MILTIQHTNTRIEVRNDGRQRDDEQLEVFVSVRPLQSILISVYRARSDATLVTLHFGDPPGPSVEAKAPLSHQQRV